MERSDKNMNETVIEEVMERLIGRAGIVEVYHVTHFQCYRDVEGAYGQKVFVEILDRGPAASSGRYTCVATTEDGKLATGNPAPSIQLAIMGVHWNDLD
jgi:hypothetical protein